jgi:hypothetical protein
MTMARIRHISLVLRLSLCVLVLTALSSCAAGTDNYENNKDPSALPEKPSNDDTKSKLDVAQRDFGGFGVITSRIESITQLKMSAEEGHAPSQHRLGDAYRLGQGLKKRLCGSC